MAEDSWFDEDAGPLVRPFALTRGRTRPGRYDLDMITLVVAIGSHREPGREPEYARILAACQRPVSVAEVSATVDLPLVVVKVLLSDLIERGELLFRSPPRTVSPQTDRVVLQAVLDGVRNL
ncbi:DUF742 domain-containing protein [Pseudonocardia humida]|uniref:DUF742 domain-containing protein n=1 Tax=Pseudonocardia humida TaxID=2800819 RepID=A0ABT1A8F7_9PSEU|nr:DUF742 domain-containing protein [Pseudonocardia humida]MCO1659307.1 DUF742 domain-containing protein [Pseudonocardia humida]